MRNISGLNFCPDWDDKMKKVNKDNGESEQWLNDTRRTEVGKKAVGAAACRGTRDWFQILKHHRVLQGGDENHANVQILLHWL